MLISSKLKLIDWMVIELQCYCLSIGLFQRLVHDGLEGSCLCPRLCHLDLRLGSCASNSVRRRVARSLDA